MGGVNARELAKKAVAVLLLVVAAGLLVSFFERLPIENTNLAMDWRGLWAAIQGGTPKYGIRNLRNPPWSLLFVLPLGLLSFRASWGLLTLTTLGVLVVSVPRLADRKMWLLGVMMLVTSFPAMRHTADGNFEGLVIAGILLVLSGYSSRNPWSLAVGVLLATAKPQETWLLMIAPAIYALRTWPIRKWLTASLVVSLVAVPSLLLYGRSWLSALASMPLRGCIMDCSLSASIARLGFPRWVSAIFEGALLMVTLYVVLSGHPSVSRTKAGMLIAISLLLAPYSAGNSFLAVLAIGIIPLLQFHPRTGIALIALTDLLYITLALPEIRFRWSAYYWTAMLILTWGIFASHVYRQECKRAVAVPEAASQITAAAER